MLFKQTMNPPSCRAHFAENVQNIHKFPATVHITWQTTLTREPPQEREVHFPITENCGVCLNGTTVLFIFVHSQRGQLPHPGWLSQFLGRLRLLLGDLLLRHDGHPWWYWPGDGLLGYVVVVDEGEEASTAPRALRGVAAIHPSWHTATLLLQRERKQDKACQGETMWRKATPKITHQIQ